MAKLIYQGTEVGTILIDPAGTNMGIQWNESVDQETKNAAWDIFFVEYPTGQKIEDKDIILS